MSKTKMTKLLGVAGIVLLLVIAWVAILSPRMGKAGEINTQADAVNQSNSVLDQKVKALQKQAKNLGTEVTRGQEVATAFPATADLNNLFGQVSLAAQASGIPTQHVTSLTQGVPVIIAALPGGLPSSGGVAPGGAGPGAKLTATGNVKLAAMPFTITASGSPAQLLVFLRNIDSMPRAYLISSAVLGGPAVGNSTVSLTGQLFVMSGSPAPTVNPDGSVTAPKAVVAPGVPVLMAPPVK